MERRILESDRYLHEYDRLIEDAPEATPYVRREYYETVADWLDAESAYLAITRTESVVAALPLVLKRHGLGNVINSGPYFGTYGGIVTDLSLTPADKTEVRRELLSFFIDFAEREQCVISNIIFPPYERDPLFFEKELPYDYRDRRMGQITHLPAPAADRPLRERLLYDRFSKSCRRSVRDAEDADIEIGVTTEPGPKLDGFYEVYRQEMMGKGYEDQAARDGGNIKEKAYFEHLMDSFGDDCRLRYATIDDDVIMGIVQLLHGEKIQYHQPTIDMEYRNTGATNLGVYESMKWGIEHGYSYYNFGGTWLSQEGLYNFKRRFGALDSPYKYYITEHGDCSHLRDMTPAELQEAYPGFYIMPYDELEAQTDGS